MSNYSSGRDLNNYHPSVRDVIKKGLEGMGKILGSKEAKAQTTDPNFPHGYAPGPLSPQSFNTSMTSADYDRVFNNSNKFYKNAAGINTPADNRQKVNDKGDIVNKSEAELQLERGANIRPPLPQPDFKRGTWGGGDASLAEPFPGESLDPTPSSAIPTTFFKAGKIVDPYAATSTINKVKWYPSSQEIPFYNNGELSIDNPTGPNVTVPVFPDRRYKQGLAKPYGQTPSVKWYSSDTPIPNTFRAADGTMVTDPDSVSIVEKQGGSPLAKREGFDHGLGFLS